MPCRATQLTVKSLRQLEILASGSIQQQQVEFGQKGKYVPVAGLPKFLAKGERTPLLRMLVELEFQTINAK